MPIKYGPLGGSGGGTPGVSKVKFYQFSAGTVAVGPGNQNEIAAIIDDSIISGTSALVAYENQFQLGVLSVVVRPGIGFSVQVYNPDIVNSLDISSIGTVTAFFQ